ncbi:glutathione S-transferase [Halyomorpha halys]|uniref:glutathione S-transferase n=1 Tax=Halyomorpha halys TaxID=286706 RepID=UPI0006D50AB3
MRIMVAKLTYFAMMGLGEPIRLIFAATNIEFEDIRIGKEEWQKLKPTLKLPHLPMLEMDGKTIFQAIAICRYLARKNGLCGSSEDEALDIDVTVDTLEDMRKKTVVHYYQPDSEARTNGLKEAINVTIPSYLKIFDKQLEENKGYLVAGKFTWADILFLSHTDYLSYLLLLDILVNFPNLKKYREKISDLPGIKEYLQKRPPHPGDCRVFFF